MTVVSKGITGSGRRSAQGRQLWTIEGCRVFKLPLLVAFIYRLHFVPENIFGLMDSLATRGIFGGAGYWSRWSYSWSKSFWEISHMDWATKSTLRPDIHLTSLGLAAKQRRCTYQPHL